MSRRQILQLSAAAAAAGLVVPGLGYSTAAASSAGLYAQDLELVTVSDTGFVLTWYTASGPAPAIPYDPNQEPAPVPADGVVHYGTDPNRLDRIARQTGGETAYHRVEVRDLRPGTTYYYRATSGGVAVAPRMVPELTFPPAGIVIPPNPTENQLLAILGGLLASGVVTSAAPGSVTTLVPPRGRLLFTLALANDLHIGETVSGLAIADFPPGFSQTPGLPPYPVLMTQSMTADAAALGADALLVAGDLSSAALPTELSDSKSLLNDFGRLTLGGPLEHRSYVVARGNHDQPKTGSAYDTCTVVGDTGYFDCLPAVYDLPQGRLTTTELHGLRVVGLDTTTLDLPSGAIDDAQFADLQAVLADEPDRPTLVFGHHPVTDESALSTISGPGFDLDRADAARLEALYAKTPGVFFHHSGHTHRNKRTSSPVATGVEFLEVAATKEYPGGFAVLRVYEGGYMVNFHKSSSALARQWSQTSSGEYLGLYPAYTLGTTADRNHVVARDFSKLRNTGPGHRH
ncbi:MAG TPA: metallophosphoesterase family protein [Actinocrinis sp.]|nr:metallophosphoesterase family protein [Actinocrinis sp.]